MCPEKPSPERTTVPAPRRPALDTLLGSGRQPAEASGLRGGCNIAGGRIHCNQVPEVLAGKQLASVSHCSSVPQVEPAVYLTAAAKKRNHFVTNKELLHVNYLRVQLMKQEDVRTKLPLPRDQRRNTQLGAKVEYDVQRPGAIAHLVGLL